MESSNTYFKDLAIRYFNGHISRTEEDTLFCFVRETKAHEELFRRWEKEWLLSMKLVPEIDTEWKKLETRIVVREEKIPTRSMLTVWYRQWQKYVAVAVVMLILVGTSWYSIQRYAEKIKSENIFTLQTGMGEKSSLVLADGTKVYLNAGSLLQYSGSFNARNREVILSGEAYFEVTKQPGNIPFTVKTDQYDVIVKGTKFNVSSYQEDELSTTALVDGSIDILYEGKHISVAPGELVKVNKRNGELYKEVGQTILYSSWVEGRVEYDKITLKELTDRLSRKYDVSIQLAEELEEGVVFRISLRNEETIDDILQALTKIIPIQYERKGRTIYIRKQSRNC